MGFYLYEKNRERRIFPFFDILGWFYRSLLNLREQLEKVLWFLKCSNTCHCVKGDQIRSFSWSVFSCILTQHGNLQSNYPYSVQMQENTDQKKLHIWTLFTLCAKSTYFLIFKGPVFFRHL